MPVTEKNKQFYFEYLDKLRENGDVNMFGATPYLSRQFPQLSKQEARDVLKEWMDTFSERQEKAGAT